jgi:hypothetical protein
MFKKVVGQNRFVFPHRFRVEIGFGDACAAGFEVEDAGVRAGGCAPAKNASFLNFPYGCPEPVLVK